MQLGMGQCVGECRDFSNRLELHNSGPEFTGELGCDSDVLVVKLFSLLQHAVVEFLLAPVSGGLHEGQNDGMGIFLGGRELGLE